MTIDGITQHTEEQSAGIVQSMWSVLFASFFVFFFFLPGLSSLIAKLMLIAAIPFWWTTRAQADRPRMVLLGMMLLPLLAYLASMAMHGWDMRPLARPSHLLLAVLLCLALRPVTLRAAWITAGMAAGMLPALAVAIHERYVLAADRVFGPLSGADFGNFAASLASPLILAGLLMKGDAWSRRSRMACVAAGLIAALIAFWSGSRTGWLIMLVTAAALPLLGVVSGERRHLLWMPAALMVVLVLAGWPTISDRLHLLVQEVRAFVTEDSANYRGTSLGIRLESMHLGLRFCEASPLVGIGYVNFKEQVRTMADAGLISAEIPGFFGMLHNQFLDFCVLGGLPALFALCAFWAYLLFAAGAVVVKATDHHEKLLASCVVCVLLGYCISATGGSMFSSNKGTVFLCICLVMLYLLDAAQRRLAGSVR